MKYLTHDEMSQIIKAIPTENMRDRIIFMLMAHNGLRVGEVVGETEEYITKNGARISVKEIPKNCIPDEETPEIIKGEDTYKWKKMEIPGVQIEDIDWEARILLIIGKGSKQRAVPLDNELLDLLKIFVTIEQRKSGQLITKSNKTGITPHQVRYLCTKYARDAGVEKKVHPHMFRHGFAVDYLNNGGNIRALQMNLGHSSLTTTARYLQLSIQDLKKDKERVEKMRQMGSLEFEKLLKYYEMRKDLIR